ncbi:MAG: hypothetical protein H7228_14610 [Polaromonas sp.]|nr:hypothetical protein [Polaromonas sp.]
MFSEYMRKIDRTSGRNLLFIAAALVIVCQLVAMALVADGQVKKAEIRESQLSFQRVAMARCFEVKSRFDRDSCMQQVNAEAGNAAPVVSVVSASSDSADESPSRQRVGEQASAFGSSPETTRGLIPVAFN